MPPARPRRREVFPDRLRAARDRQGWSQAELAEKSGFQASAISRFETGAAKPSFENLRRLAGALRVSTDYLLGLSDDPTASAAHAPDPLFRKFEGMTEEQRDFAAKLLDQIAELGKRKP